MDYNPNVNVILSPTVYDVIFDRISYYFYIQYLVVIIIAKPHSVSINAIYKLRVTITLISPVHL